MSFTAIEAASGDGGADGLTTISYQTGTTASQHAGTITFPSGINSGDVLIVMQNSEDYNNSIPAAYGTGFTSVGTVTGTTSSGDDTVYYRTCVSMKVADGTEASASIGGFINADDREGAVVYVYRPNVAATAIAAFDVETQYTNGNPTAQTINASSSTEVVIAFGCFGGTTDTNMSITWSVTSDQDFTVANGFADIKSRATGYAKGTAVDITADTSDSGSANMIISGYIEVTAP